jgi:hypothetical protein
MQTSVCVSMDDCREDDPAIRAKDPKNPMTQITRRRRKKRRFYWVELGFLLLGLIGLRPEILTELFPNNRPNPNALTQLNPYNTLYAPVATADPLSQPLLQPAYQAYQPAYQAYQPAYQAYPQQSSYSQPQYDPARVASNPSQVTSRYSTNPAYPQNTYPQNTYPQNTSAQYPAGIASGSSSSSSSTPPVVWPEGYQPSGSNYYRR